jgi:hypothetical protein
MSKMFTFNRFLRAANLDLGEVRLVRHKPSPDKHRQVFDAAMSGDVRFQSYQELQGNKRIVSQFRAAKHLAGFVVEPITNQTVFMGIWDMKGERTPTEDGFYPLHSDTVAFETLVRPDFDDYRGRLIVDWGKGERAWLQRADQQDKPIIELRKERQDPAFPGFNLFRIKLDEVPKVATSWKEPLRHARGVYLLVHDKGEQYVGSASGEGGFLARWLSYCDGHGGNVAMKQLAASSGDYHVSILEVAGSDATTDDIVSREMHWMTTLGTRVHGLNR